MEQIIEHLTDLIAREADDTSKWTQEESAEIYEAIAEQCTMMALAIREESGWG